MNTERFEKDEGGMDLALYMAQVIIIILRKNGDIKSLRPVLKRCARPSHNARSIGACYEGGLDVNGCSADTRTDFQKHSLRLLAKLLLKDYPHFRLVGHRDLSADLNGNVK